MNHGHFKTVCSKCHSVVAQCRCMEEKPTNYVDGCPSCPEHGIDNNSLKHGTELGDIAKKTQTAMDAQ